METRGLRRGKGPLAPWVLTPVSPARGPSPVTFQMEVSWGFEWGTEEHRSGKTQDWVYCEECRNT